MAGPWVKSGFTFPIPIHPPGLGGPALSKYTTTIRVVDGNRESPHSSPHAVHRVDSTHVNTATYMTPSLQAKPENTPPRRPTILRLRTQTPETPPTDRRRGKTEPLLHTPLRDTDADTISDTQSIASFSPSMRGRHLATWFSGLLGR
jgi:hypothetical protein